MSDEGRVVDGTYRLEASLGAGAMGSVHRARHLHLGKVFALKLINPSVLARHDGRRRFETEAKALGRLTHPNVVRVTDYGVDDHDQTPYLVMEHLDGETLAELVAREGPLPPERALTILQAIAEGLDFAHAQGVLHRDLKPHNVFVSRAAIGVVEVKIVDFGLARMVDPSLESLADLSSAAPAAVARGAEPAPEPPALDATVADRPHGIRTPATASATTSGTRLGAVADSPDGATLGAATRVGAVVGTAAYMAPEVADGQGASVQSDLYSLGVLAFEILAGRRPFVGGYANVLRAHVFDDPPQPSALNPSLPPELDRPLVAALAKQPGQRPASAQAFVGGLRRALDSARQRHFTRRELPRRALLAAALTAATLAVAWALAAWSVVADLEHRLVDLRFRLAAPLAPHPALAVVLLDDATLAADPSGRPTAAYADEFGEVLRAALAGGARGVGLDIMVPAAWAASEPFFRLLVDQPERVVLAIHAATDETLVGTEVAEGAVTLALGPERAAGLFAYANLSQERDGSVRVLTRGYRDLHGAWHPTLAGRVAEIVRGRPDPGRVDSQWVDYRRDWRAVPTWSWRDFRVAVTTSPSVAEGRFFMIGGRIAGFGDEDYPLPAPGGGERVTVPGVVVQTVMAATVLADGGVAPAPGAAWLAAGPVLGLALFGLLWRRRLAAAVAALVAVAVAYAAVAVVLFTTAAVAVPMAPLLLALPLAGVGALVLRFQLPARP